MATLFDPMWANETNGVKKIQRDARIEVLLCPPPTSPSHTVATFMDQDSTGPWRPRSPSQEDQDFGKGPGNWKDNEQLNRLTQVLEPGKMRLARY
jgi:hypothetical protein